MSILTVRTGPTEYQSNGQRRPNPRRRAPSRCGLLQRIPRIMMLLEHDAKELLAAEGVPVPVGMLATTVDAEPPATLAAPWMVKVQIPVGGPGKAGGIRRAETAP